MKKDSTIYSWTILEENLIIKDLDKSFNESGVTGIPTQLREFFECQYSSNANYNVNLHYNDNVYVATIETTKRDSIRSRIFTKKFFQENKESILRSKKMIFNKINKFNYMIELLTDEIDLISISNPLNTRVVTYGTEGKKTEIYSIKYERNKNNRDAAIKIHGLKCYVCGFDFYEKYGELGKNYIEVHHKKPLYSLKEEIIVNPIEDLVCLCSNCHRMIHRHKNKIIQPDELKKIVERSE